MPEEIFVLDKTVLLLQPEGGFRTSLDSVLVAAACPAGAGERVLDLGCGVGGASFCLLHRVPDSFIFGFDIQLEYIDLADKNAALNNNTNRCEFIFSDVRNFKITNPAQRFAHAICNPPFLETGTYTPSPDSSRATALGHREEGIDGGDWVNCAFHALQPGGSLSLIHRADHIDRIIQALGRKFGALEIIPLWPRAGEVAKRVILRARKDRRTPATLHPGLVLHNADGSYTPEAEQILRGGAGLFV